MTNEQIAEQVIRHGKEIAALSESIKSAHRRINENDRVTEGIHKIAANVETLTLQIKHLTDSTAASSARHEASIKKLAERIGELEKKPAKRWETLVSQLIALVVAAVVGCIGARLF